MDRMQIIAHTNRKWQCRYQMFITMVQLKEAFSKCNESIHVPGHMVFISSKYHIDSVLQLTIGGIVLEHVSTFKLLGLMSMKRRIGISKLCIVNQLKIVTFVSALYVISIAKSVLRNVYVVLHFGTSLSYIWYSCLGPGLHNNGVSHLPLGTP